MTTESRITGGCRCGALRYEADGAPWNATACHCADCRGTTGAPVVGWITVRRAACRFTAGTPTWFRSSPRAQRAFCPACGTHLAYVADDLPEEIDLTTASLDDPERFPPRDHVWVSRRLSWVALPAGLPTYPEERNGP